MSAIKTHSKPCGCSPEVAAGSEKAEEAAEEAPVAPTPEQLEIRLKNLLDTCTYVVYNYTRRGLFDRDKLIVLTLLTFQILLTVRALLPSVPCPACLELPCEGACSAADQIPCPMAVCLKGTASACNSQ